MLREFLSSLGLSDKETQIVLALAELGTQPASAVARRAALDRVTAYKNLRKLADRGLVRIYYRDAVQCFGLESLEVIEGLLREHAEKAQEIADRFPTAAQLLKSLGGHGAEIPKLEIFEGNRGMQGFFRNLLQEIEQHGIRQVRVLTSNTYEEKIADEKLRTTLETFFVDIRKRGIGIEFFEATGGMVPEQLRRLPSTLSPEDLLRSQGTTNVFLAGTAVYLASYRGNKIGLKVQHHDLSQIFHFLFDLLGKRK
jgi:DNA-binding Lrp family transcriptional regulator